MTVCAKIACSGIRTGRTKTAKSEYANGIRRSSSGGSLHSRKPTKWTGAGNSRSMNSIDRNGIVIALAAIATLSIFFMTPEVSEKIICVIVGVFGGVLTK